MENLNRAAINLAVDHPDAVAIASGSFVEATQESRAFRRQSERDRNHRINWLCRFSAINVALSATRQFAQRSSSFPL
jgi:hypothetical protein